MIDKTNTENTSAVTYEYDVKKKEILKDNSITRSNLHCCAYMVSDGIAKSKNRIKLTKVLIKHTQLPEEYRKDSFVDKWIDFINELGLDITLEGTLKNKKAVFKKYVKTRNYYHLFCLNLVRYLWSTKYDYLPKEIMMLRSLPELKKLTNWEIFQLGHHTTGSRHFHDMSPIRPSNSNEIYAITSDAFLKRRLYENMGSNLDTFNVMLSTPTKYSAIQTQVSKKNYLNVYKLLSATYTKSPEYSKAKCINDEDFTDEIKVGNNYNIGRIMKSTIRIKNAKHYNKLYSIKRFELI
jgi:hypothetical protein